MDIIANEVLIFLMRAQLWKRLNSHTIELSDADFTQVSREYEILGRDLRKMLRKKGYKPDIEIDNDMVDLAQKLLEAYENLHNYIVSNSPRIAADAAKLGLTDFQDYQKRKSEWNALLSSRPVGPLIRS
ncbi:MAG: hypothetical protein AB7G25_05095 [Sphingomonadaceae bacterium]